MSETDTKKSDLSGWIAWPLLISFLAAVASLCCMAVLSIWEADFEWRVAASTAAVSGIIFGVWFVIGLLTI